MKATKKKKPNLVGQPVNQPPQQKHITKKEMVEYFALLASLSLLKKQVSALEKKKELFETRVSNEATEMGMDPTTPVEIGGHQIYLEEKTGRISWKDVAFKLNPLMAAKEEENPPRVYKMVIQ